MTRPAPSKKTIRVRITHTLEIDVDAWVAEYGDSPGEVRDRVKSYFDPDNYMPDHLRDIVEVVK